MLNLFHNIIKHFENIIHFVHFSMYENVLVLKWLVGGCCTIYNKKKQVFRNEKMNYISMRDDGQYKMFVRLFSSIENLLDEVACCV